MTAPLDQLLAAGPWVVLAVVGLVVFVEDALFVGFVIPGETAALLGGVAAQMGHVPLPAVIVTVVMAAIVGDSVGYEVGRHLGPRILQLRALDKRRTRLDAAQDFLARRGGMAVLLGRWVAFFRAVMPALAGAARMPYRTFLTFNAIGGLIWGVVVVAAGYLAGSSYARVEKAIGRDGALIAVGVVVLGIVIWKVREHRARSLESTTETDFARTGPAPTAAPRGPE
jgi:membrane protein DedA with SNARE-associated domain